MDAAKTAQAIHDALSAASILGMNWLQTADNTLGYTGTPFEGPVTVRLVPASEITEPYGHRMGRDQRRHVTRNDYVYEITFLGEVHDTPVSYETVAAATPWLEAAA